MSNGAGRDRLYLVLVRSVSGYSSSWLHVQIPRRCNGLMVARKATYLWMTWSKGVFFRMGVETREYIAGAREFLRTCNEEQ